MNTISSKTYFLALRACGPRKLRHGSSSDTAIYLGKTCPQFPTESFTLSSLSKSQLNKCNQACPCIWLGTLDQSLGSLCTSFRLSKLSASFRKENDKPFNYFRTKSAEHLQVQNLLWLLNLVQLEILKSGTSAPPPPPHPSPPPHAPHTHTTHTPLIWVFARCMFFFIECFWRLKAL